MIPSLNIRLAGTSDAEELCKIGGELFRQTYEGQIEAEDINAYIASAYSDSKQLEELADPEIASFLVERESQIIGYFQLRHQAIPLGLGRSARLELWHIYLDKRWHGQGIAQQMIKTIRKYAVSKAESEIWLAVWDKNDLAISFYKKHSFEVVGHQPFKIGDVTQNDFVMCASVASL